MDTGVLYCNDNLERLSAFEGESVDLIYLDPPFFSNRTYEVIWGDEAEVRSFEDRWEGGIQHYVDWMQKRVQEMHRVLKKTGSFYLHCDPHASHYLKVMLDGVFGAANFRNELIWKRTGAHGAAHRYGPIHDTILFYTRGSEYTWNPQFAAYDAKHLAKFDKADADGRMFHDVSLTGPGTRQGDSGRPWRDVDPTAVGRHWQPSSTAYDLYEQITGESLADVPLMQERLDSMDAVGLIFWPTRGKVPRFKQYLDVMPGTAAQDMITDIPPINSKARERLGYPTQKPEALIERLITASSVAGDVVLDPFCGCGTTIAVAERLGREWIGVDISPTAMEIMRRRLWNQSRTAPTIVNMPSDEEALRRLKPFEFQNWVVNTMNGSHSPRRSRDGGIDGYSFMTKDPIQVKQSIHAVGRVVLDQFETAMRKGRHDIGYIVGFSFTKDAYEEVARAKRDDGLNIKLLKVKELLLLARRPDRRTIDIGPQPEGDVLPLPPTRKKEDLPTAEELIESDKATAS